MNKTVIQAKSVSKMYKLYNDNIDRVKEALHPFKKEFHRKFYALNKINLDIYPAETVGIIGKNGSGKSTFLKIISGIIPPTEGHIDVKGKVSAILELGAGFNMEMTGEQNVYFSGTIMGYTKQEMSSRVEEIEEFADIGDFFYQPVKTYSSGMYARLAFAVAINVNPEILIIDEVLSVGDAKFQMKCINKMTAIREQGTTILFVSHAMEQIKRFCTKAVWFEKGNIKMVGEANDITNMYTDSLNLEDQEEIKHFTDGKKSVLPTLNKLAVIKNLVIENPQIKTFDQLKVCLKYEIIPDEIDNFLLGIAIYTNERSYVFGPNTYLDNFKVPNQKGIHEVEYIIPKLPLMAGTYFLDVGLFTDKGLVCLDFHNNEASFTVNSDYISEGLVHIEHKWIIK